VIKKDRMDVHATFWRVCFVLRRLFDLNFEYSKGLGNT